VIVPAYGVAHLLGEALDSLRAQTFAEWECVVIDDGARDDVAGRGRAVSSPIRGSASWRPTTAASRPRATERWRHERGLMSRLLDGDDLYRPEYLARTVAVLDADPDARLVTCNARIFGAVPHERLCFDRKQGSGDGTAGSLGDVLDRSFGVYIGTTFRRADFDRRRRVRREHDPCRGLRLVGPAAAARRARAPCRRGARRVPRAPSSASASAAKMIAGNLRVYEKALAQLGEGPRRASPTG
jgi:hypothetical protein